jgi:hypothetical protein
MTDQLTRDDIAKILVAMERTATEVGHLATAVTAQDRRVRIVSIVGSVAVAALLFVGALQLSNRAVISAIEDCTKPAGECYQQSQARTSEAVATLSERLRRIEERSDVNRQLLCLGVPDTRRPADLCPMAPTTTTTTGPR